MRVTRPATTISLDAGRTSTSCRRNGAPAARGLPASPGTPEIKDLPSPYAGGRKKGDGIQDVRAAAGRTLRDVFIPKARCSVHRIFLAMLLLAAFVASPAHAASCASRLFASAYFTTVYVFDACTGEFLRPLDTTGRIRGAQAVRLGPDGLLYVTSEIAQQILRYRNDTLEFVDVFATIPGIDPTGFAFGPGGDLYVAGFKTDEVRRLSPVGAALGTPVPARAAGLDGPDNGITFGPDGNLYVPGYNSSNVIRYDPRTGRRASQWRRARRGSSTRAACCPRPAGPRC